MDRVWTLNASSTLPAPPASMETGYVKASGNATVPGYYWYHMVTETLMDPIVNAAGLTANRNDLTQLTQAIKIIANQVSPVNALTSVRVVDTVGVPLSGVQVIDGVTVQTGDRILRAVGSSTVNGVYIVNTGGSWTRSADMPTGKSLANGILVDVNGGATNLATVWILESYQGVQPVVVDTVAMAFADITATTKAMFSSYLTQTNAASTYLSLNAAASTYMRLDGMSNYLTTSTAASTYLRISDAQAVYETQSAASGFLLSTTANALFLAKSDASATYLSINDASNTYLRSSDASSLYETQSAAAGFITSTTAANTYLRQDTANSTYLTQSSAASTYLTINNASSTYATTAYVNGNFVTQTTAQQYLTSSALTGYATTSSLSNYVPLANFSTRVGNLSNVSLATNGYRIGPDGIIEQWGQHTSSADSEIVSFPIAFTTVCFNVMISLNEANGGSNDNPGATLLTKTGFTAWAQSQERVFFWRAIGY